MAKSQSEGIKIITDNRKARFLYEILETYEAGIALVGTEVKSIRAGRVNIRDGYGLMRNGEAWLLNVHISPYDASAAYFNHDPRRSRKLLLKKQEINKLVGKLEQQGLTLVPLKLYFKRGKVKVALGLGRGKKLHDKRETVKKRQDDRDIRRTLKQF
ncbi:SsrA-binding protein SmpB [Spirulina major]|jgi:SsrA-binding protein|uniref:SsrA-binding protein SmpB n=1 Tax=Spirulina major TaxID=270636 RepID=UPI0009326003|nr:SsrA-binding protein SmpB [Spirulina major]